MRSRAAIRLFLAIMIGASASAEIIDRIAVTVDNTVITESDIFRQIRLTAFLNGEAPDYSLESRRRAADMLVEQAIIRREMSALGSSGADAADIDPQVIALMRARYPNDARYKTALTRYRLTDETVRRHLEWQTRLVRFIDIRFRPGVQVPETEKQEYYRSTYVPEWTKRTRGKPPTYDEASEAIEQELLGARANQALDRWLGQMRTQTRIRYNEGVFR